MRVRAIFSTATSQDYYIRSESKHSGMGRLDTTTSDSVTHGKKRTIFFKLDMVSPMRFFTPGVFRINYFALDD